ncbi:hypothetical protein OPT61_g3415 [Boeremia exigua]|uniref:Uncharacterized protein n=1 Tax=Boeremia exigua TaxID=749465 RepID=A0ACC2IIB1_9PLEO|nr:hypothetical protein OPT61_g3415 [Boeremia exigua]
MSGTPYQMYGVKLRDTDKCKYCTEKRRPCIRGNAFRFRPVKAVKFNAGEDIGSAEQSLEFGAAQTWVEIPRSLHFFAPNTDGDDEVVPVDDESQVDVEVENTTDESSDNPKNPVGNDDTFDPGVTSTDLVLSFNDRSPFSNIPVPVFSENDLPSIHDVLSRTATLDNISSVDSYQAPHVGRQDSFSRNESLGRNDSLSDILQKTSAWHNSPGSNPRASSSPNVFKKSPLDSISNISPYNSTTFPQSPSAGLTPKWPVSNAYEARLFHHYIIHCTDWIDVCDPRCHFAKEVPKRAAHFPVILHGILGLAARHLWLMGKELEDHSQPYVDQCLNALIVALEDPLAHWDENFLVAVILLRLHEEMGDDDDRLHHFGTARILNSISSFAADGGLRESASWVSLRQHIYVSLTSQQPLNLSLENYRHSAVFREFDDESWTNRAIFHFATILQAIFEDTGEANTNSLTKEKWTELHAEVDEWERTKPWTFSALHIEPDAGDKYGGSWPQLPCHQGVVAVGLQYYHLCKIILTIYSPNASLVGLAGVRARKATDALIRKHMRITIGYGISNEHCGNAMFQGSHILSACGAYIVDPIEQDACVEYLHSLQRKIGWRTDKVIADLKEQWST